jgi:hypothetical protein
VTGQSFIDNWIQNVKEYPPIPGLTLDALQIADIQQFLSGLLDQLGPLGIAEAFNGGKQLAVRDALQMGENLLLSFSA